MGADIAEPLMVGRVLRASTTGFALGCSRLIAEQGQSVPEFGALVKAPGPAGLDAGVTYGLIYNVSYEDDPFSRQIVAAGIEGEEYIKDLSENRQVPIVVEVLAVGYGRGLEVYHRLPPQPPSTLSRIYACNNAEIVRFTVRPDWMRTVLGAGEVPADQLLTAALRLSAQARPPDQREDYLIGAGRELARLLSMDLSRLDGVLRQLR